MRDYILILPAPLACEMDRLSIKLNISYGEVIARALQLLGYAIEADSVQLVTYAKTQNVIVK